MKLKTLGASAVGAVLSIAQAPAFALDTGNDRLQIAGFGTVAATHSSVDKNSGAYFNPTLTAANSNKTWDFGMDSKFGLQATAQINPALSATVQALSQRDDSGAYSPTFEWAYVKYEFTPDTAVRVGRVGLPTFLISDNLNVGYAHPWLRAPVEVYKMMPLTHIDGVDALFRFHMGDTLIKVQPVFGSSRVTSPAAGEIKTHQLTAANVVVERGPWTARYGKLQSDSVFAGASIKDNFNSLGVIYDQDQWLLQGEYVWRTTNDMPWPLGTLKENTAYVTAGYRIGNVMPNITFSRFVDDTATGILNTTANTTSLGVRWDFYKNMALKAQWDHITRPSSRPGVGYIGNFSVAPGSSFTADNKAVNVIAVGLDFVF